MTLVLRIAQKSLANRWSTALLTVLSLVPDLVVDAAPRSSARARGLAVRTHTG